MNKTTRQTAIYSLDVELNQVEFNLELAKLIISEVIQDHFSFAEPDDNLQQLIYDYERNMYKTHIVFQRIEAAMAVVKALQAEPEAASELKQEGV